MTYIDSRHKALWHLDALADLQRTGKTKAPVNVEIDLSNRCSLGCEWCHFAYTHTRGPLAGKRAKPAGHVDGGDVMSLDLAYSILRQLAAAGVKSVTWTGGGEPTLHPHFNEIIEHARSVGLEQGIYTHGGHIDDERAALLKRLFTWVFISLDEADAESYKRSKGVNQFERVCTNIEQLATAQGKATIGIGFLLHPLNYLDTRKMIELGKSLGADYVQFRPTIQYSHDAPDELNEDTAWLAHAIQRLRVHTDNPFVIADIARFEQYRTWTGHGYNTCYWSGLQTAITPNGKVWRCANKREYADALLGDLAVESFDEIWKRAGGACAVDGKCRVLCRGHLSNQTINAVMKEPMHSSFI